MLGHGLTLLPVHGRLPDVGQELLAAEDLVGVGRQEREKIELASGQRHQPLPDPHRAGGEVDVEHAVAQVPFRRGGRAPEDRVGAGHELAERNRATEAVIGPQVEGHRLISVGLGPQHPDHGDIAHLAEADQRGEPGRRAQLEQHHIRLVDGDLLLRRQWLSRLDHVEPLTAQPLGQQAAHRGVGLGHEHPAARIPNHVAIPLSDTPTRPSMLDSGARSRVHPSPGIR